MGCLSGFSLHYLFLSLPKQTGLQVKSYPTQTSLTVKLFLMAFEWFQGLNHEPPCSCKIIRPLLQSDHRADYVNWDYFNSVAGSKQMDNPSLYKLKILKWFPGINDGPCPSFLFTYSNYHVWADPEKLLHHGYSAFTQFKHSKRLLQCFLIHLVAQAFIQCFFTKTWELLASSHTLWQFRATQASVYWHLYTCIVGGRDQSTDLPLGRQPTLPPELQLKEHIRGETCSWKPEITSLGGFSIHIAHAKTSLK